MMIKWFSNLFDSKEKCDHDWEVVKTYPLWKTEFSTGNILYHKRLPSHRFCPLNFYKQAKNKVCIKCGECHNGIDIMKKEYEEDKRIKKLEIKKIEERKQYAKQLWENSCKNEST